MSRANESSGLGLANPREVLMNWDQVEGKWKQISGRVKEKWGKLTDSDLNVISGKRDQLIGKIQERYGIVKEEAQKQVDEFTKNLRLESAEDQPAQSTSDEKAHKAASHNR
jgi:uncharacterized protein YjbJ (UPF0337 family)